jgi:hypothetical protein
MKIITSSLILNIRRWNGPELTKIFSIVSIQILVAFQLNSSAQSPLTFIAFVRTCLSVPVPKLAPCYVAELHPPD